MKQLFKFNYPYKVWLSTVLASPFALMFCFSVYNTASISDYFETLPLIFMMILFGLGLSLPALFLYKLLFKEMLGSKISFLLKKLVLAVVGVSFIWITFYFFDRDFFKNSDYYSLSWPGVYSLVLLLSTFLYKMEVNSDSQNQELA